MSKYRLTEGVEIVRIDDNKTIPPDQDNMDYREFLAWKEEGNTPMPVCENKSTP